MFDDVVPPKSGQTPPNLPLGEPEDIFAKTDTDSPNPLTDSLAAAAPPAPAPAPTALTAGVLRPKESSPVIPAPVHIVTPVPNPIQAPAPVAPQPVMAPAPQTMSTPSPQFLQEERQMMNEQGAIHQETPFGGRKFTLIIVLLVIGILIAGTSYIYFGFIRKGDTSLFGTPSTSTPADSDNQIPPEDTDTSIPTTTNTADDNILFGEPIDTDGDSITDDEESTYGTSALNWDTDTDGLSDGDEVFIWKTDPRNPDTDADGYSDGVEMKNGYNPSGPGKLFEPPTSTMPSSAATASSTVSP